MLVIRLARGGRTKYPVYRVVAAESSRAATGKFIEVLGSYNPHTKEVKLDKEAIERRLAHGAQPSNSVVRLLMQEKIELPSWVKLKTKQSKPKSEPEEKPAAEAPAEDAPVTEEAEAEAPNEEAKSDTPEPQAETATEEDKPAEDSDKA
ncbi:30S ribosomal protein S16 [Patescibacteria group bacterium]|nr:MAG: 30S ribosomal protein S16 [Patescibacteria group bacterium]